MWVQLEPPTDQILNFVLEYGTTSLVLLLGHRLIRYHIAA